jgi:hypothetical protein
MRIDRAKFFSDWTDRTHLPLSIARLEPLRRLIDNINEDAEINATLRHVAYLLATIRWETGHTFVPIKEQRASTAKQPDIAKLQDRYWSTGFYGRGYVQITWRQNYANAGQKLTGKRIAGKVIAVDSFTMNPDAVLDPDVAYAIASGGMREGWFTTKKLSDYINDSKTDYRSARKIINGTDHAEDVAGFANQFELLLRSSSN